MQTVGVNAITLVSFVILARLISPKQMGIWTILSLVNATCIVFATWFPQAITKYVAENTSKGSTSAAAGAFYQGLRANLILYLPVVTIIYVGAAFLSSRLIGDISYAPLFQVLAFDTFFYGGIIPLAVAALLGLRMFRETAVVGLIVQVFRQILIISLLILMKNFIGLVIGWLVSDIATATIYLAITFRALGRPRFDFSLTKLFRYYLPLELQQIVGYAATWFDRAILLLFVPLAVLGIYNAASTAFGVLIAVSGALVNMLFPALSSIQDKIGGVKFRDAIRLATRYACLTLTPIDFGLLATARPAIDLFLGQAYLPGALPLMVLCAIDGLTAFATAFGPALLALEETKEFTLIFSVDVGVSITIAYVIVPYWGILGAAFARALAVCAAQVLFLIIIRRKITLHIDPPIIAKTLIAGITMAAVLLAAQHIHYNKFFLPAYVLIGGAVYLVTLRLLKAIDLADIDLLRRFLGKRFLPISSILSWILLPKNLYSNLSHSSTQIANTYATQQSFRSCPNCESSQPPSHKYCDKCGTKL